MKKNVIKLLSGLLVGFSLFTTNAFAGTWKGFVYGYGNITTWSYTNDDGTFPVGWKYIDGYWYYFENGGFTRMEPLEENGKTYYFNKDGQLLTSQYVKVGSGRYGLWYWANSDGSINYDYSWLPGNLD